MRLSDPAPAKEKQTARQDRTHASNGGGIIFIRRSSRKMQKSIEIVNRQLYNTHIQKNRKQEK